MKIILLIVIAILVLVGCETSNTSLQSVSYFKETLTDDNQHKYFVSEKIDKDLHIEAETKEILRLIDNISTLEEEGVGEIVDNIESEISGILNVQSKTNESFSKQVLKKDLLRISKLQELSIFREAEIYFRDILLANRELDYKELKDMVEEVYDKDTYGKLSSTLSMALESGRILKIVKALKYEDKSTLDTLEQFIRKGDIEPLKSLSGEQLDTILSLLSDEEVRKFKNILKDCQIASSLNNIN